MDASVTMRVVSVVYYLHDAWNMAHANAPTGKMLLVCLG